MPKMSKVPNPPASPERLAMAGVECLKLKDSDHPIDTQTVIIAIDVTGQFQSVNKKNLLCLSAVHMKSHQIQGGPASVPTRIRDA